MLSRVPSVRVYTAVLHALHLTRRSKLRSKLSLTKNRLAAEQAELAAAAAPAAPQPQPLADITACLGNQEGGVAAAQLSPPQQQQQQQQRPAAEGSGAEKVDGPQLGWAAEEAGPLFWEAGEGEDEDLPCFDLLGGEPTQPAPAGAGSAAAVAAVRQGWAEGAAGDPTWPDAAEAPAAAAGPSAGVGWGGSSYNTPGLRPPGAPAAAGGLTAGGRATSGRRPRARSERKRYTPLFGTNEVRWF